MSDACPPEGYIQETSASRQLASTTTADHSSVVGSQACPWRISVQPYQTINITVVDFSVPPLDGLWYSLQPTKIEGDTCTSVIGYVTEAGGSNVSLCAGMRREVVAYQSRGSAVQVAFTRRPSATPVLIKYTGESSTGAGGAARKFTLTCNSREVALHDTS